MAQNVKGTFFSGGSSAIGQASAVLVIPTGVTAMKLTLSGSIDASNTVKTQKSLNNGQAWSDQTTYNSAQTSTSVTVDAGEQWRLVLVAQQATRGILYGLSAES